MYVEKTFVKLRNLEKNNFCKSLHEAFYLVPAEEVIKWYLKRAFDGRLYVTAQKFKAKPRQNSLSCRNS